MAKSVNFPHFVLRGVSGVSTRFEVETNFVDLPSELIVFEFAGRRGAVGIIVSAESERIDLLILIVRDTGSGERGQGEPVSE